VGEGAATQEHELDVVGKEGVLLIKIKQVKEELNLVLKLDHLGIQDQAGKQLQPVNEQVLVGVENLKH
jgi:hypothetical protein